MALPRSVIKQFVDATNTNDNSKSTNSTVYGEIVEVNGDTFVKIDGSETITPITTTAKYKVGDRVVVMVKDHTATVTGNITDPSASSAQLDAQVLRVETMEAEYATIGELYAKAADIEKLIADSATIEELEVAKALIDELEVNYADIYDLEAVYATITELNASYVSVSKLKAAEAVIESLDTTYANIDFANIGQAAMEYFYAKSGLIEDVIVGDGTITGNLIGVTITGDMIKGNTIQADKLVIKGEDGLYYKLNFEAGTFVDGEEVPADGLHGSVIVAKSITATQISVNDLVAFDATIGGFNISSNSIYSDVKESVDNTTRGVYLDTNGQVNIGDADNFIKYYQDEDGTYKLAISADSITYAINGSQHSIADLDVLTEYVKIGKTDEGEPCIELGEADSDFKLIITNTRIMFKEGTAVPAYINNQSLHISKATIEDELRFGQFVWKNRANGNMGLIWQETT